MKWQGLPRFAQGLSTNSPSLSRYEVLTLAKLLWGYAGSKPVQWCRACTIPSPFDISLVHILKRMQVQSRDSGQTHLQEMPLKRRWSPIQRLWQYSHQIRQKHPLFNGYCCTPIRSVTPTRTRLSARSSQHVSFALTSACWETARPIPLD